MATVITHVYNESFMLGFWLRHHVPMFDHGIIIDYASTDNTATLCKELAPNWEVRPSRNDCFRAADCDAEVMDVERGLGDTWKIALTATEFLCGDVTAATESLAIEGCAAALTRPVAMVDLHEHVALDYDTPLVDQCHTGYLTGFSMQYKARLLHRHADGAYTLGRHDTNLPNVKHYADGLLCKWFGFAPWVPELRARRMQIQTRIPQDDKDRGYGFQHQVNEASLTAMWQSEVAISGDLRNEPDYF